MSLDTYLSVCYNNIAHFGCCCGISWRVSSASVSPPCKNQGNLNWLCKSWHNHFQLSIFNFQFNKQVWRNWQTRMVQVHVKAISCRFKSCYLHQQPFLMQGRLFCIALSVCFMVIFKIFELILNKKRKLCWQIRKYGI